MAAQLDRKTFTTPNGAAAGERQQGTLDTPSFWERSFTWENLTVAGREVKGFVVSPAIATVLLAAFLGVLGYGYKSSTADNRETREAMVRMETMLNERTRTFERQQDKMEATLSDEVKLAGIRREQDTKKRLELLVALRQQGIVIND